MNSKQIQEFFEQVKGKKIRWSNWTDPDTYFIPTSLAVDVLIGCYFGSGSTEREGYWWISKGFVGCYHHGWILLDEEEETFENMKPLMLSIDPLKRKL